MVPVAKYWSLTTYVLPKKPINGVLFCHFCYRIRYRHSTTQQCLYRQKTTTPAPVIKSMSQPRGVCGFQVYTFKKPTQLVVLFPWSSNPLWFVVTRTVNHATGVIPRVRVVAATAPGITVWDDDDSLRCVDCAVCAGVSLKTKYSKAIYHEMKKSKGDAKCLSH
jgi:hypothetical protein